MSHLSIFNDLTDFEKKLQQYVDSVQRFDPKLEYITDLLKSDEKIEDFIKLIINHQNFGRSLQRLKVQNLDLNKRLLGVMEQLGECRKILLELPDDYELTDDDDDDDDDNDDDIEGNKFQFGISNDDNKPKKLELTEEKKKMIFGDNPLTTKELLEYAAKLAKFTTVPSTTDLNVGPSNNIWPGEDALRRGALAMAIRYRDELISLDDPKDEILREEEVVEKKETPNYQPTIERSSSFDAYHRPPIPETNPQAPQLDLFDSDEESE